MSLFEKLDAPGDGRDLKPVKHNQYFKYKGDLDPDQYAASAFGGNGVSPGSTIVPRSGENTSMYDRTSNCYGRVVEGKRFSGSDSITQWNPDPASWTNKTAAKEPAMVADVADPVAVVEEPAPVEEPSVITVQDVPVKEAKPIEPPKELVFATSAPELVSRDKGGKGTELDSILEDLKKQNLAAKPNYRYDPSAPEQTPIELKKPASTTKVILKGPFGTYRGTYRHVYISSEFIVLVYDEDSAIYAPPPADTAFQLKCGGEEYSVVYMGIEFELPCLNAGVQVMIRNK
jgi:hypothetical protein